MRRRLGVFPFMEFRRGQLIQEVAWGWLQEFQYAALYCARENGLEYPTLKFRCHLGVSTACLVRRVHLLKKKFSSFVYVAFLLMVLIFLSFPFLFSLFVFSLSVYSPASFVLSRYFLLSLALTFPIILFQCLSLCTSFIFFLFLFPSPPPPPPGSFLSFFLLPFLLFVVIFVFSYLLLCSFICR